MHQNRRKGMSRGFEESVLGTTPMLVRGPAVTRAPGNSLIAPKRGLIGQARKNLKEKL